MAATLRCRYFAARCSCKYRARSPLAAASQALPLYRTPAAHLAAVVALATCSYFGFEAPFVGRTARASRTAGAAAS